METRQKILTCNMGVCLRGGQTATELLGRMLCIVNAGCFGYRLFLRLLPVYVGGDLCVMLIIRNKYIKIN